MSGTRRPSSRQRMINMMYLVLTAMLALNVSAEVLRAFYLMEKSIDQTSENIDTKNKDIMLTFDKMMVSHPERARDYYSRAKQAGMIASDFNQYVENLKNYLVEETGGRETNDEGNPGEAYGKSNIEKHANYLINEGKGAELKKKINETREQLLSLLDSTDKDMVVSDLIAEDYGQQSWESFHFEQSPLAAVVAMLAKIQNDSRNTLHDVNYRLLKKVTDTPIVIDRVQAQIVPKSGFVMSGQEYEAEIFLTAFDSKQANDVVINGQKYTAKDGKVTYKVPAGGLGEHRIQGQILVKESDSLRTYSFHTSYNVYQGVANVSADNMKLLYIGVDNPITISVPGVPPDKVRVDISEGRLVKTGESKYEAHVTQQGDVKVTVSVRDDYGNWRVMNAEPFRVRQIPTPDYQLGSLKPGKYTRGAIVAQRNLVANMGPSFYFRGLTYQVTGFRLNIYGPRLSFPPFQSNSSALTPEMQNAIRNLPSGSVLVFSDVGNNRNNTRKDFTIYVQ